MKLINRAIFSMTGLIMNRPKTLLVIGLLGLLSFTLGLTKLKTNFSYRIWFNTDSQALVDYDKFESVFGNDENSVLALHNPSGVFNKKTAQLIQNITNDFWKIKDVIRVNSLSNFNWTHGEDDDILVDPFFPESHELDDQFLSQRKKIALSHKSLRGYFVSKDANTALFYVKLRPFFKKSPDYDRLMKDLTAVVNKYKPDHQEMQFYLTGSTPINASFKESTREDMKTLIPLVLLVVTTFLAFSLRNPLAVVLSLFTIGVAIIYTMGSGGYLGLEINNLSATVPQFMIAISIAVVVHLLVTYYLFTAKGYSKDEAIKKSLQKNIKPTLLTSLSTAFGFFSFSSAGIPAISEMGVLAGVGTLLTWIATYLVMAPLMVLLPIGKWKPTKVKKDESSRSEKFVNFIDRNKKGIIAITILMAILDISLAVKVAVNSDPLEYFDKKFPVSIANDFMEANVGGSMSIETVVDSGSSEGIKDPDFLAKVESLQHWLDQNSFVSKTISIVDILKDTNKSLNGGDQNFYRLPTERKQVAEQLFLYSMGLPQGMDISNQMTIGNDKMRVTAMVTIHDSMRILKFADEIENKATELGLSAKVNGKNYLWQTITGPIIKSFGKSLTWAIALISLLLIFGLGSVKLGLLAMIPNTLPIIFGGGALFVLGKYLDIGTVIVAAITLGIAVDDTIHFLNHFKNALIEGKSPKEAITEIFSQTAMALIVTTLVLVASFGTFYFGTFVPNQNFGIMVAIILTFALICDLIFLPALLLCLKREFFIEKEIYQVSCPTEKIKNAYT